METLSRDEIIVLKDLLKTEMMETRAIKKDASKEDKKELNEYIRTLKSINDKLFPKKTKTE